MTDKPIAPIDAREHASAANGLKIATCSGMSSNRVVIIALFVSLVSTTALATPVTYQPAPADDSGVAAAPYDESGGSDNSVLFDQSGTPLLWVSMPIYLRLPIFGAGAFASDGDQPGLAWVPGGSGSGSGLGTGETPGSTVPPSPENDLPGDDFPGDDVPGDDGPRDEQPPVDEVPEPATLMLLTPAAMLLMRRRRQSQG